MGPRGRGNFTTGITLKNLFCLDRKAFGERLIKEIRSSFVIKKRNSDIIITGENEQREENRSLRGWPVSKHVLSPAFRCTERRIQ